MNMRCELDPDVQYIESSYIEIRNDSMRCHCNVLGLTSSGSHAGSFRTPPSSRCSLVVSRCPLSQILIN